MSVSGNELVGEALALLRERNEREAIDRLQRAVEVQPDHAEAWGHLSGAMALAGRHEDALRCVEQVLRLVPDNVEARWRIADRLVRLNQLDGAEAQYRGVLENDPSCHDARCGLLYVDWLRKQDLAAGRRGQEKDDSAQDVDNRGDGKPGDRTVEHRRAENEQRAEEHFERSNQRLVSLPLHLQIENTTRCNASCIMCPWGHSPCPGEDLATQVFERIEKDLLPVAVSVNLTGVGEPLLGRRFDPFYAEVVRHGARFHINTNGTALSMARLDGFARRTTHLSASVDGATRDTFESIRKGIRFDRVVEKLRVYKKIRDVYPDAGSTLTINFVAMRWNLEELPDVVDLAAELGAQLVFVMNMCVEGLPDEIAAGQISHCPDLANRVFDEASERARHRGVAIQLPPKFASPIASPGVSRFKRLRGVGRLLPARDRFPQRCAFPWMSAFISVKGLVHPCCVSDHVMGDLNVQNFEAIWNGRPYRRFRRRISSSRPPIECRHCRLNSGINAGNPSPALAREGLLLKLLYRAETHGRRFIRRARNPFLES